MHNLLLFCSQPEESLISLKPLHHFKKISNSASDLSLLRTTNGILFLALQRLCRITHGAFASINPMPINTVARVHPEPLSIYEPAGADRGRRHISRPFKLVSFYLCTDRRKFLRWTSQTDRPEEDESENGGGEKRKRKRGRALSALSWQKEPPRSFVCANQPCAKSSSSADLLCCVTAIDLMKGINTGRPHGQRRPHKSSGLPRCWCCLYFGPADVLPGELCRR